MSRLVKITYTFTEISKLKIVGYYNLTDDQYRRLMDWSSGDPEDWLSSDSFVITKHNLQVDALDSDPIIQAFMDKYGNPCDILENIIQTFRGTNFFSKNYVYNSDDETSEEDSNDES